MLCTRQCPHKETKMYCRHKRKKYNEIKPHKLPVTSDSFSLVQIETARRTVRHIAHRRVVTSFFFSLFRNTANAGRAVCADAQAEEGSGRTRLGRADRYVEWAIKSRTNKVRQSAIIENNNISFVFGVQQVYVKNAAMKIGNNTILTRCWTRNSSLSPLLCFVRCWLP